MKTLKILSVVVVMLASSLTCMAKNEIPQESQDFIKSYFGHYQISNINVGNNEYKVTLSNDWILNFNKYGQWDKVTSNGKAFPKLVVTDLLPKKAVEVLAKNNKETNVTQISFSFDEGYRVLCDTESFSFTKCGALK